MTGADCNEWKGLVALDLVGQTDPEQHQMVAEHLEQCVECRLDVAALTPVDAALKGLAPARGDAMLASYGLDSGAGLDPDGPAVDPDQPVTPGPRWDRNRRLAASGLAGAVAAAGIVAAVLLGRSSVPASRTVALTGQPGVSASASLVNQRGGTRVTLVESGQRPNQVMTVSMETTSGHWWVAGSYRTDAQAGGLKVVLSCPVPIDQISNVWVSDQRGRTILHGYVS